MSSERHYFWSGVTHTYPRDPRLSPPKYKIPRGADTKIGLRYYKISGRSWINAPDATVFNVPKLVARKLVSVNLSDVKESPERRNYIDFMAKQLSGIGVPGCEQLDVLEKIFDVIDVTVPGRHIIVFLADVTVQLLDNASNLGEGDVTLPLWINGRLTDNQQIMLQRLMMDFSCGVPKGSPATLSSIQDLEKVRLDSLEAAVRQMDCAICIDHFYAAEEGNDHHHMIVRLPCSHMYHEDCIGQWLENNQRCPLCRCTVVLHRASKPLMRLHWPMLMLSAVGYNHRKLETVFYEAEVAIPGKPIIVCIADVTLRLLDSESNLGIGDVTFPLWCNGRYMDYRPYQDQRRFGWFGTQPVCSGLPKPIPATESLIEGLKKVRLDDLEDVVRQMPCSICMEALDHFVAAEEGTDHQHIIARLPCSHIYHGDCIIPWLKTNYVCPLCRSPVGKPPKPPLRVHWPMLMMSAVGMLTATIIPRLLNRS
ncbi:PREDICTED: uncharacterized protein LOC101313611 [Fragaria vesca subsp. vesca]